MFDETVLDCVAKEIEETLTLQIDEVKDSIRQNPDYVKFWISENLERLIAVAVCKTRKIIVLTEKDRKDFINQIFEKLEKVLFEKLK